MKYSGKEQCEHPECEIATHVRGELSINKRRQFNISLCVAKHGVLPGCEIIWGWMEKREKEKPRKMRQETRDRDRNVDHSSSKINNEFPAPDVKME